MSDVMLLGVLRMPPELWADSPIDVQQRHAWYMQAAAHIECATIEIEYLQAELAEARRERDRLRAAIAGTRAPHGGDCASWWPGSFIGDGYAPRACDCWKRAALEGKP